MATNTAGTTARENATQQINYIRKAINEVSGTTITVGIIPAGSIILPSISGVNITTVFSGTDPVLDLGVTGTLERFASDLDLDAAATFVPIDVLTALKVATDTTIIATLDLSTPVAANGAAEVIICYIPNI